MKVTIEDPDVLQSIQPSAVIAYLQAHGWHEQKQIGDYSAVWVKETDSKQKCQLLLPLNQQFDDFPLRMSKVLQTLENTEQRSQLEILADLTYKPKDKENFGSVADLLLAGASTVLSAFPPTAVIGSMANFAVFTWLRENQRNFEREVRKRISTLDKNKLDYSVLESDDFKSLTIAAVEIASKSSSDLKRQALANLLVNSALVQTEQFIGGEIALRLIRQLSDEEMLALTAIYKLLSKDDSKKAFGVSITDIQEEMNWSEEETRIACEALLQLNLIFEPPIRTNQFISLDELINVRRFRGLLISDLGNYLIKRCQEEEETVQPRS